MHMCTSVDSYVHIIGGIPWNSKHFNLSMTRNYAIFYYFGAIVNYRFHVYYDTIAIVSKKLHFICAKNPMIVFKEEVSQIAIQERKRYGVGNFTKDSLNPVRSCLGF